MFATKIDVREMSYKPNQTPSVVAQFLRVVLHDLHFLLLAAEILPRCFDGENLHCDKLVIIWETEVENCEWVYSIEQKCTYT